jgi:hypothetical protein
LFIAINIKKFKVRTAAIGENDEDLRRFSAQINEMHASRASIRALSSSKTLSSRGLSASAKVNCETGIGMSGMATIYAPRQKILSVLMLLGVGGGGIVGGRLHWDCSH